jgi:hypothetical protein
MSRGSSPKGWATSRLADACSSPSAPSKATSAAS